MSVTVADDEDETQAVNPVTIGGKDPMMEIFSMILSLQTGQSLVFAPSVVLSWQEMVKDGQTMLQRLAHRALRVKIRHIAAVATSPYLQASNASTWTQDAISRLAIVACAAILIHRSQQAGFSTHTTRSTVSPAEVQTAAKSTHPSSVNNNLHVSDSNVSVYAIGRLKGRDATYRRLAEQHGNDGGSSGSKAPGNGGRSATASGLHCRSASQVGKLRSRVITAESTSPVARNRDAVQQEGQEEPNSRQALAGASRQAFAQPGDRMRRRERPSGAADPKLDPGHKLLQALSWRDKDGWLSSW
ncbi:hypothetical protein CKAH01_16755 [Colletotrichum kahawae]|uniref:Uncharacterized protein n=1 Tax=Colletotrichum kahawae TaxID=34407 RepID=A0AAD9YC58_COLKA|nr:hypothetical protein CKAH01_16755 [Colletotrichum kahawae]